MKQLVVFDMFGMGTSVDGLVIVISGPSIAQPSSMAQWDAAEVELISWIKAQSAKSSQVRKESVAGLFCIFVAAGA